MNKKSFKYVVIEGVAIAGVTNSRKDANRLARDSREYYTQSGFKVTGNLANGYTVDKRGIDGSDTMSIKVMTLLDFCNRATYRQMFNTLVHLNLTRAVYGVQITNYENAQASNITTAELDRFIWHYGKRGIVPDKEYWRG